MHEAEEALRNTGYEHLRLLGRGASGVVFRAYDPARHAEVALKVSRGSGGRDPHRLKREFRVRADVEHPNLVQLYELEVGASLAFYSMEFVDGVTFDRVVARERGDRARLLDSTQSMVRQIADALLALHAHGVTHGDVKPHNVMMAPDGRAVLIDFDLSSRERTFDCGPGAAGAEMVGTLGYMAPEVALGAETSLASDVYSLAAAAFEAATGAPPHWDEEASQLVTRRLNSAPVVDDELRRSHPVLHAFLSRALAPAAAERPGRDALAELLELSPLAEPRASCFYGRRAELARLCARSDGEYHAFVVDGPSGIGKTTLVARALRERERHGSGLTLTARCYPAERVPFNAVDGCIDGLAAFFLRRTAPEPDPGDALDLSRVFPQFEPLAPSSSAPPADEPSALLPRARAGLAKILARLASQLPVRVFIDDFQWCDRDSLAFLRELERRRVPVTLFIAARELGDVQLEWLRAHAPEDATRLELTGMDSSAIAEFARARNASVSDAAIGELERDTQGNPFLLDCVLQTHAAPERLSVPAALAARCDAATPNAARLLSILCIAGAPLARSLAHRLCGTASVELARAGLLARAVSDRRDAIVPSHDRVSAFVCSRLSATEQRELHAELADALIEDSPNSPGLVAHHLSRAGRAATACAWHVRAARQAEAQCAWGAAADHYLAAVEGAASEDFELLRSLGRASENAGKPAQAAEAFRAAARWSREPIDSIRAAEVLWGTGEIARGKAAVNDVFALSGLRFHTGARSLAAGTYWRLRARAAKPAAHSTPVDRLRCELCFAVGGALAVADAMGAYALQGRAVYEARKTGAPEDLVRALGPELIYVGATSLAEDKRERLRAELSAAGARTQQSGIHALAALCRGYEAFLRGELVTARAELDVARRHFRESNYLGWPSKLANRGFAWVLWLSGRYAEFRDALAPLIDAAHDSADYLTWMQISALSVHESLLDGDVAEAQRRLGRLREFERCEVPAGTLFVLDHASLQLDLYAGDWSRAKAELARLKRAWRPVMRFAHVRVEHAWFTALEELLSARPRAAGNVTRVARWLLGERLPWARALGHALSAAVEAELGNRDEGLRHYELASTALADLGFAAHADAARLQAASLAADAARAARLVRALRERGVRDVKRWLRITMPGPLLRDGASSEASSFSTALLASG